MGSPDVSVVIPVLNAGRYLPELLPAILAQDPAPPREIVLVDSGSDDDTRAVAARFPSVRVIPIEHFSHGRARNLGAADASGAVIVLMTQDAVPAHREWMARLLSPLADPQVAASFSRQMPRPDASPMERFFLQTHFPPGRPVRRERTRAVLGLRDVFFSNVSAAVRRSVLLEHPFDESLIMSEDQQFARDVLYAGYATVYQPDSVVVHSHNYSLPVVFKRYLDSVYSLRIIFPEHGLRVSSAMGIHYLTREAWHMVRHHPFRLPYYALYVAARTLGTYAGHAAEFMPRSLLRRLSLHSYHWT